jgi:hypothetical protein
VKIIFQEEMHITIPLLKFTMVAIASVTLGPACEVKIRK